MNERTHVDLFSGLAGFSLAARANGVRTIAMCECDERCQAFLAKAWPGVPVWGDVRTFNLADARRIGGERWTVRSKSGTESAGRKQEEHSSVGTTTEVWLLTAGVPCQPASRAGKQRGKDDDRWLWPAALRVFAAIRPAWALFENPPGIGDVGLSGILSQLEGEGYAVRVFSIPACAIGAPHRRERYWIVCKRLGNSEPEREQWRPVQAGGAERSQPGSDRPVASSQWSNSVWLPCADGKVRRAPDDSFSLVDGLHRSLLGALGNSIVPQVAERIIAAMIESEETTTNDQPRPGRKE